MGIKMGNDKKDELKVPKPDIWDYLHKVNKAALSVAPPLAAFYEMVIAPPFQKKND